MSDTAANEAVAHRWHMELFVAGNLDVADEILAPEFAFHAPRMDGKGAEAAKQLATGYRATFADLTIEHVDTVAAGDKVAIRWTSRSTRPRSAGPTPVISPSSLIFYTGSKFAGWRGSALIGALSGKALLRVTIDGGRPVR